MATVLNPFIDKDSAPSLGEMLGGILNQNVSQMQTQGRTAKGLEGMVGREKAQQISMLPPNLAQIATQQAMKNSQRQADSAEWDQKYGLSGSAGTGGLQQALGGMPAFDTGRMETPIQEGEGGLSVPGQLDPGAVSSQSPEGLQALLQQLGGQAQPQQAEDRIGDYIKGTAGKEVLDATGNKYQAVVAEQKAQQKAQQLDQASKGKSEAAKEKTISKSLDRAATSAKEASGRIEANQSSKNNYKEILKGAESGKIDSGLKYLLAKQLGVDKALLSKDTQILGKRLAQEPIMALRMLPAQSARLTKVFETLKDMHGDLSNTPEGLAAIARLKIAEASIGEMIESKYLDELEGYRVRNEAVPFNLKQTVAKSLEGEIEPLVREAEFIASDDIDKQYKSMEGFDELKEGGEGTSFTDTHTNKSFKLIKIGDRLAWEPFSGE